MELKQGARLQGGKYTIERMLGQGGFGITYLGTQTGLNRWVAIKEFFMKDYCFREEEGTRVCTNSSGAKANLDAYRTKFLKEARHIATLDHPNIIRVYDVFEENDTAYYVMEYIDGGSLADRLRGQGPFSEGGALMYIRQLAAALEYLHGHNMLHLDVKPANVLLKPGGQCVLIDFGLSKCYNVGGDATSSTPVGISHGFAPLEQYNQEGTQRFQPATDVYALGATLYNLLTAEKPPAAMDLAMGAQLEWTHNGQQVCVDKNIRATIQASMAVKPDSRPQTMGAFLRLLEYRPEERKTEIPTATVPPPQPDYKSQRSYTPPEPPKPEKTEWSVVKRIFVILFILAQCIPFVAIGFDDTGLVIPVMIFSAVVSVAADFLVLGNRKKLCVPIVVLAYAFGVAVGCALIDSRNFGWYKNGTPLIDQMLDVAPAFIVSAVFVLAAELVRWLVRWLRNR